MATIGFGDLVRAVRYGARFTQEELAHASGVSVRTIVDLERGQVRRPRADTVRRIAEACGLAGSAREDFEEAARADRWRDREVGAAAPASLAQLPPDVAAFSGRADELARLDAELAAVDRARTGPEVVVVSGTAGVGKTALAVYWAHRVAGRFPDGHLYAHLRGFDPAGAPRTPQDVLRGFLEALGVPPQHVPADLEARSAMYRSRLAGRRVLLLLDDARDAAQVRPLLPGVGAAFVMVTSRDRLAGLVATQSARVIPVDLLDPTQARHLIATRVGEDQLVADPAALAEVIARCAGLPLALAVVAARLATGTSLAVLAGEFREAGSRLDPLGGADPATDVRVVLATSYRALDADAASLLRLLGVHPGPDVSGPAAASLVGGPGAAVRPLLDTLVRAHLLTGSWPGRYTRHDLLRVYTAELAGADPEAGAARLRLLDHLLHSAHAADRLILPARDPIPVEPPSPGVTVTPMADRAAALAWFGAERPTIVAAVRSAADAGHDRHAWQLAWASLEYLDRWGHWADAAATHEVGLAAAERQQDPRAQAFTHRGLGRAYGRLGRLDDAERHLRRAAQLFDQLGAPVGTARTHLSLAGVAERRGDLRAALDHAERAVRLFRAAERPIGVANALNTAAWYHSLLGDHATALAMGGQAIIMFQTLDDTTGLAATWDTVGVAHHGLGSYTRALESYRRALDLYRANKDQHSEAAALDRLGDAYHALGDRGAARRAWERSAAMRRDLGDPAARAARTKLAASK